MFQVSLIVMPKYWVVCYHCFQGI